MPDWKGGGHSLEIAQNCGPEFFSFDLSAFNYDAARRDVGADLKSE